jgi:hypothetical protein
MVKLKLGNLGTARMFPSFTVRSCETIEVRVQITKRDDGAGLLKCIRDDRSCTWQKQPDRHAAHFALHDLTHFAVETTLGYRNAFFGLLEQGWDMDDVTGKGGRGPLPAEATEVESIVGLLDAERAGVIWTCEEFNQFSKARQLTADEMRQIKARRSELFGRWFALGTGQTLDLEFLGAAQYRTARARPG